METGAIHPSNHKTAFCEKTKSTHGFWLQKLEGPYGSLHWNSINETQVTSEFSITGAADFGSTGQWTPVNLSDHCLGKQCKSPKVAWSYHSTKFPQLNGKPYRWAQSRQSRVLNMCIQHYWCGGSEFNADAVHTRHLKKEVKASWAARDSTCLMLLNLKTLNLDLASCHAMPRTTCIPQQCIPSFGGAVP